MQRVDIPGLPETDRAFRTESGEHVAVRVKPQPPDEQHFPIVVQARWIDEGGNDKALAGEPVRAPARPRTIRADAIAEGRVQLQNEIADEVQRAVERFKSFLEARKAFADLPKATPERVS